MDPNKSSEDVPYADTPATHIAPFVTNAPSDMTAKGWHSSCTARLYWCLAKQKLDIFHLGLYYIATHQHQLSAFP